MAGHFFLSYSRRDQDFALRLAGDLRSGGASIWIDQVDIRPSDRWDRTVETAVRDCDGIVLILSPRSAASDNVLDEVAVALDAGKPVIPVLIEACQVPLRLARVHFIDARGDYEAALAHCRSAMAEASGPNLAGPGAAAPASPAALALPPETRAKLTALLTQFMGPISAHLVAEESRRAESLPVLADRLAAQIPGEKDRARFLAAARSLG